MEGFIGRPILAIDFDGTIRKCKRATDKEYELMPNCKRVLRRLWHEDYRLVLWTCRSRAWLEEPIKFLKEQGIFDLFECINENVKDIIWWDTRKIYADVYIDDLNLQGFPGWLETYDILTRRFVGG